MNKDLISIIIPVYNVENYLEECIESVIAQSYKNLEILLINDGSTDNSLDICKVYANKDSRIKIINKKNGGLSDARNVGIDNSLGMYITFLDSDDYVSHDYIECMYKAMIINGWDLAFCGYQRFSNMQDISPSIGNNSTHAIEKEVVLSNILYQKNQSLFSVSATCKLYKTELFSNVRFPVGKVNEDMATFIPLIKNCDSLGYIEVFKYYYRINYNSITLQGFNSRKMDAVDICKRNLEYISTYYPELEKAAQTMLYSRAAENLTIAVFSTKGNQYREEKKRLKSIIKETKHTVLLDVKARPFARISALICYINIYIMVIILHFIRRMRY